MRRAVPLVVAALLSLTAPALAQTYDTLAEQLADQGYGVEPGARVDEAALARAVGEVRRSGTRLSVAVLAAQPPGGETTAADALLDRVGEGTVLVVGPGDIGYASDEFGDAELDAAADEALDDFRRDTSAGVATFGAVLERVTAGDDPGAAGAGSRGGFPIGVAGVLLLGLLGLAAFASFSGVRSGRRLAARRVQEARAELRRQIDAMADGILTLSDRVSISASEQVQQTFAEASDTFREASDAAETAATEAELVGLNDRLDRARWQLEVTEALLDGRTPPPQPDDGYPTACFFDPDHGSGVVQAEVRAASGSQTVEVCRDCAALLERGEAPQVRTVPVNGVPTPVPQAPRTYGGPEVRGLD
ncbi:MAG: hypothetical protein H0V19_10930, partial [Euzebyales bacterium]|nr:hypothetical protein [Euzebyales bacterium]